MDRQRLRAVGCGLAAGLVNGLFGAGGGMVLVPLMRRLKLAQGRQLFSSAPAIMLPMCVVSIAVYWMNGGVELQQAAPYCAGGLVGGLIAGLIFGRVSVVWLHRLLGLLILWGGVRLLVGS